MTNSLFIGTTDPKTRLHVESEAVTGGQEQVARFTVADATGDQLQIRNGDGTNGQFAPTILGQTAHDEPSLSIVASSSSDNGGDDPLMTFSSRINGAPPTDVQNRPLFRWEEPNTVRMQMNAGGNLGIGTTSPAYQLELSGTAGKPGDAFWTVVSDMTYKTDVESFDDGLSVLELINPISYRYDGQLGLPTDKEFIGVSAQEMQQIAPYMVETIEKVDVTDGSTHELLSYNGNALLYIMVNSIKELKQQNDNLTNRLSLFENEMLELIGQVYQCCSGDASNKSAGADNGSSTVKEFGSEFILDQNDPNPFSSSTRIEYSIPNSTRSASLVIFDSNGKTINNYKLSERGIGSVTVFGSEVESGVYYYSLVLDGKIAETKRMIRVD